MKYKLMLLFPLMVTFCGFSNVEALRVIANSPFPKTKNSTLDQNDYDRKAAAFLERFKKAVQENDKNTIARKMVHYPFIWQHWIGRKKSLRPFYTPEDFIQHYNEFMTPAHKKAVLEATYKTLNCIPTDSCIIENGLIRFHGEDGLEQVGIEERKSLSEEKEKQAYLQELPCSVCNYYLDREKDEDLISILDRLKKAVLENDKKTISEELITYPFRWNKEGLHHTIHHFTVYEPKEFIEHYDAIMIPLVKDFILGLEHETEKCLYYPYKNLWSFYMRCVADCISINREGVEEISQVSISSGVEFKCQMMDEEGGGS